MGGSGGAGSEDWAAGGGAVAGVIRERRSGARFDAQEVRGGRGGDAEVDGGVGVAS